MKSVISLEMKCPQLSKPEATAPRNQNSIGDRMEKKTWEKPGSVGGPVPLRPDEPVVCSNCSKVRLYVFPTAWQLAVKEGVRFRRRLRVQRTGSMGRSPHVEIFGPCQPPRLFSGKESLADPQVLLFWECLLPTFRQQQLWEEERKIVSISYFHEDSF